MIKGDEISESAKAVQEVAKTSNTALEVIKDFGGFVGKIVGEPIEIASGIFKDKLIYFRWKNQQRLTERANKFIAEKNIEGELKPLPLKVAIPIIENGILEDNEELQDIWAQFIASAVDPNFDGRLRTAFIDIIKQLEVVDVHILSFIYDFYNSENEKLKAFTDEDFEDDYSELKDNSEDDYSELNEDSPNLESSSFPVSKKSIMNFLGIDEETYKESVDNLIRVRCIASHISEESFKIPLRDQFGRISYRSFYQLAQMYGGETINFNVTYIYDMVCITSLGISFAKACMRSKANGNMNKE